MDEYSEEKRFVEKEKPSWVYLSHPRGGEMRLEKFNYYPAAHKEMQIQAEIDELYMD